MPGEKILPREVENDFQKIEKLRVSMFPENWEVWMFLLKVGSNSRIKMEAKQRERGKEI